MPLAAPSGMIYIPACTLITSVDPARFPLFPWSTAAPRCRCAVAPSDLANYNTCTGKCKVQRAGKPQSLNNIRYVRRILRENRLCHRPSAPNAAVSPLVVVVVAVLPVSALFLTGLSFVTARPGSFPSPTTIPLHNHRDLPLDTCHQKTLLPADARCVAPCRVATRYVPHIKRDVIPIAFLAEVEMRTKGIDVRFRRTKAIDGLTQIAALTRLRTLENQSSVGLRTIK